MKQIDFIIRNMTRDEVDLAIDWAAAEGWNPGHHDAECYFNADPCGFFIGLLDDEPIGCISAVAYGETSGFLGFYIVKPGFRGKGYGKQLWNAGVDHLKGRNIGLDGVVAHQEDYERSGFQFAYRNIRYEGAGGGDWPDEPGIVALSEIPFEDLKTYDDSHFFAPRLEFLGCWINQPEVTALGIVKDGHLAGYGVIRACRIGFKIGPLFADNENLAEQLFKALRGHTPEDAHIYLDTPEANPAAVAIAERYDMKVVFETARMYYGEIPDTPLNHWFGVTSFELG